MGKSKDTIHGAYHVDFANELKRMRNELIKVGIDNPTWIETSAFITFKSKKTKLLIHDVFDFFNKLRITGNQNVK
jgi:hypothetical protein